MRSMPSKQLNGDYGFIFRIKTTKILKLGDIKFTCKREFVPIRGDDANINR